MFRRAGLGAPGAISSPDNAELQAAGRRGRDALRRPAHLFLHRENRDQTRCSRNLGWARGFGGLRKTPWFRPPTRWCLGLISGQLRLPASTTRASPDVRRRAEEQAFFGSRCSGGRPAGNELGAVDRQAQTSTHSHTEPHRVGPGRSTKPRAIGVLPTPGAARPRGRSRWARESTRRSVLPAALLPGAWSMHREGGQVTLAGGLAQSSARASGRHGLGRATGRAVRGGLFVWLAGNPVGAYRES